MYFLFHHLRWIYTFNQSSTVLVLCQSVTQVLILSLSVLNVITYILFYYNHQIDPSAGGLLVSEGIVRSVRCQCFGTDMVYQIHLYRNLQFLNQLISNKTKVVPPSGICDLRQSWLSILCMSFGCLAAKHFKLILLSNIWL